MNCLLYLRVSTKEQAEEGYSIPAQKEACIKYITDKGWNFVDCYIDRGESARSAHRPQLQEMLSRVKKDKSVDAVVVHKIDRLARNMEDHVAIRAIFKRAGVGLVSVVENIEDSASGRLVEGIHALMAEFYSANLAMETRKGMGQKAKKGGWPYTAPVGYTNIREERGEGKRGEAKIIPDPEMAPIVKEAYEVYATGEFSINQLYELVHQRGLKARWSKNPICKSGLASLLKNKAYLGIVTWDGVEYQGIHEPIISKSLFARVQEVFTAHDKAGVRMRKHPHYLRGTLFCGYCGSRLSTHLAKGKYMYFFCLAKKRGNPCGQVHILADKVEEEILSLYQKIQLPELMITELTLKFEEELTGRESFNIKQREMATKKMLTLNREREKLLKAYYAEAIPIELLKREQDRISSEIAVLEAKQASVSSGLDQIDKIIKVAIKMASNCYFAYQKASPKNKRMLNQAFFERIYLKGSDISEIKYSELFGHLFLPESSLRESLVPRGGLEPPANRLETYCSIR